jgi:hypothetical protein
MIIPTFHSFRAREPDKPGPNPCVSDEETRGGGPAEVCG